MKTLRKLFYVACIGFFFASCEETNNDKLFWPGEISQEYGSYIKPQTLDLTYSGETLIGKTVSFKTADSEKGTLTLNDVIPGEKETSIQVYLNDTKTAYTFNGETTSSTGATIKYIGSITPKTMKLNLTVTPQKSQWARTYTFADLTRGPGMTIEIDTDQPGWPYVWKENEDMMLTTAVYTYLNDVELSSDGASLVAYIGLLKGALGYFVPQLAHSITLNSDGNITAQYTTSPLQIGSSTFDNIDTSNPDFMMTIMKMLFGALTPEDITQVTENRTWSESSPLNLAHWFNKDGKVYIKLNLPAVIYQIIKSSDQNIDSNLISGVTEAIMKGDAIRLKGLLGTLNAIINNNVLGFIANMDNATFQMFFNWLQNGIPFNVKAENGHNYLYLTNESLTPIIMLLPDIAELIKGILPEDMEMKDMLLGLLEGWFGDVDGSIPNTWNKAKTVNFGLDLIPANQ